MAEYSDDYLLQLFDSVDRELYSKGMPLRQRHFRAAAEVAQGLGEVFGLGVGLEGGISKRLLDLGGRFYRPRDIGAPSIFSGIATHLDVVFRVDVPIIFGSLVIDPFAHTDATEWQLRRLNSNRSDLELAISQVADVWDIGVQLGNFDGYTAIPGKAGEYFGLAAFHLQASTATLTQHLVLRGAVQSAVIASELAIKCLLFLEGYSEQWMIKNVGHKIDRVCGQLKGFDTASQKKLSALVSSLPDLVADRYGAPNIDEAKILECVASAQAIVALVSRRISGKSISSSFTQPSP